MLVSGSYYLSSHHIDIHCWIMQDKAIPTRVVASAATGIATSEPYNCVPQTEDTITLLVDWQSLSSSKHKGTAVYTASWTAPLKAGVHTNQHWYYMAEKVRTHHSTIHALQYSGCVKIPLRSYFFIDDRLSSAVQGEINVDQAHRGYDIVQDDTGKAWYNPF